MCSGYRRGGVLLMLDSTRLTKRRQNQARARKPAKATTPSITSPTTAPILLRTARSTQSLDSILALTLVSILSPYVQKPSMSCRSRWLHHLLASLLLELLRRRFLQI